MSYTPGAKIANWLSRQVPAIPSEVASEYTDIIKSIMEDDVGLWEHLGHGRKIADHEPYCQQVIKLCRYLYLFGPTRAHWAQYHPTICYGVSSDKYSATFQVWMEFKYYTSITWILFERRDNRPEIAQVKNYRLEYRRPIYYRSIHFESDWVSTKNNESF